MKSKFNLFVKCTLLACSFSIYSQNNSINISAEQMLKDFYTAHNNAWLNKNNDTLLLKKIDSLQKKYCSIKFRAELKNEFKQGGLDFDLLTNDEGADEGSNKTLTVKKVLNKVNTYVVSYLYHTMDPSYKPINKTAIIHVKVVLESGKFKIDKVW